VIKSRGIYGWVWAEIDGVIHLDDIKSRYYIPYCRCVDPDTFEDNMYHGGTLVTLIPEDKPICVERGQAYAKYLLDKGTN
jgi:hypothetical protein